MKYQYSVGEKIRIKAGPFQNFTAEITKINEPESRLHVRVNIFGRMEPVELRHTDVEKITSN